MADYRQINFKVPPETYVRWRRALGHGKAPGFLVQLLDHWEDPASWRRVEVVNGPSYADGLADGRIDGRLQGHLERALIEHRPDWIPWDALARFRQQEPLRWVAVDLALLSGPWGEQWQAWKSQHLAALA